MVKKFCKFFGYSVFFIVALIYFMPKVNLYYFLETKLNLLDVVISSEDAIDKGFTLELNHQDVYYKSIQSMNIQKTHIKIFILHNTLNFEDVMLSNIAKSFLPLHIHHAMITYTLFDPLHIKADVDGEFGKANVRFNILKNTFHMKLFPSELMLESYENTLKNMRKHKEGEFIYDKTI